MSVFSLKVSLKMIIKNFEALLGGSKWFYLHNLYIRS